MFPFPIVDTYAHLWDLSLLRYQWLAQAFISLLLKSSQPRGVSKLERVWSGYANWSTGTVSLDGLM